MQRQGAMMRFARAVAATFLLTAIGPTEASAAPVTTPDYSFNYAYPAEAGTIPALRAWLEQDRTRLQASTARQATAARRQARSGGFPFRRYELQKTWKVVTSTPRFLSLSGEIYSYTGGAHGTPGSTALLWDKSARVRLEPRAVFGSVAALEAALRPTYCARLKAERSGRLEGAVTKDGPFAACPALKELTLLLGSSDRRRIDRLGLIADPYVAGSYAEGAYEITLPVTAAVLRTVRPAYRTAFAPGR
jgi:hypothetical protein